MTEVEQGARECMNDARTCTQSGAKSAHDVPVTFTLPADLKHHMRILRTRFGAKSPIGHHASNVEGQVHTLEHGIEPGPTGEFQRANLEASIKLQLTNIARFMGAGA